MTLDKSLTVVSDLDHISDLYMDYRSDHRAAGFSVRVSVLCNAESATVLAHVSVCLSVRHILVLYLNECAYRQTLFTV